MRKEIRHFLKNEAKILFLEHDFNKDAISDWYRVRNPVRSLWNHTMHILANISFSIRLNKFFLRLTGVRIGKNTGVSPALFDPIYPELISIGNNCDIGWQTKILTHEFTREHAVLGRVVISDGVLIGAFSTIRAGVTIGNNSMIAMNSFVNKDIPPNELWGGVPAKLIKKLRKTK